MKKQIQVMAVAFVLLMMTFSGTVFAAKVPTVVYDGKDGKFTFQNIDENGLFGSFQGVMPGDECTTQIQVEMKNISKTSRLYLRAEADGESSDALEALTLTVSQNGTVLDDGNGIQCLAKDVLLGTFSSNANTTLDVTLSVPITVGNELANQMDDLQWIFTVQEEGGDSHDGTITPPNPNDGGNTAGTTANTVKTTTSTGGIMTSTGGITSSTVRSTLANQTSTLQSKVTGQDGSGSDVKTSTQPKTGDRAILPYLLLLFASGTAFLIFLPLLRKKNQTN